MQPSYIVNGALLMVCSVAVLVKKAYLEGDDALIPECFLFYLRVDMQSMILNFFIRRTNGASGKIALKVQLWTK